MTGGSYLVAPGQITHVWTVILAQVRTILTWQGYHTWSNQDKSFVTWQYYFDEWDTSFMTGTSYLVKSGQIIRDLAILFCRAGQIIHDWGNRNWSCEYKSHINGHSYVVEWVQLTRDWAVKLGSVWTNHSWLGIHIWSSQDKSLMIGT